MSIADLKTRLRDIPGIQDLTMQMLGGRQVYSFAGRIVGLDASASDLEVQNAIRASLTSDAVAQIPAGTPVTGAGSADAVLGLPASATIPTEEPSPAGLGSVAGVVTATPAEAAGPVSGTASATSSVTPAPGPAVMSANGPSSALIPLVHVTAPPSQATVQPKATAMTTSSPASHALTIKDVLTQHSETLNQILEAQVAQLQATLGDQASAVVNGTNAVIARAKQHTDDFNAILGQFTNMDDGIA